MIGQAINRSILFRDGKVIYAIGFHNKERVGHADLILVSSLETFEPIMEKVRTKTFNCTNAVDFGAAAGLQVDKDGHLYIWGTQRDLLKQIVVNRCSQH